MCIWAFHHTIEDLEQTLATFNNEPECVGATVHLAEELVDAGKILHQINQI